MNIPPADPTSPETRLLRAIFGACPDCDRTDEHEHDIRADAIIPCCDHCGADATVTRILEDGSHVMECDRCHQSVRKPASKTLIPDGPSEFELLV